MENTKPREKLLTNPIANIDTADLLSIILGTGSKNNKINKLSKELLEFLRNNLNKKITVDNLLKFQGIGKSKALQIISALELGKRFKNSKEKLQVYKAGIGQFILGDCLESMQTIADNSIILGFTSPPYHNAVNYGEHIKKLKGEVIYWERKELSYEFYKTFLIDRFKELYRIIKSGGHCVVNISPVAWEGKRVALPFHFVGWMEEIGWTFKEDIIWEKGIVRDKRSGVLMQHPYPGYYYPSLSVEYVFVFQKTAAEKKKNNIYYHRSAQEKETNRINLENYQPMSKNIWNIRPVAPQENIHPCPFPEELARRVIEFYSYKKDTVIDIFAGSGIVNIAAEKLSRCHIGLETEKEYIDYGIRNINQLSKKIINE